MNPILPGRLYCVPKSCNGPRSDPCDDQHWTTGDYDVIEMDLCGANELITRPLSSWRCAAVVCSCFAAETYKVSAGRSHTVRCKRAGVLVFSDRRGLARPKTLITSFTGVRPAMTSMAISAARVQQIPPELKPCHPLCCVNRANKHAGGRSRLTANTNLTPRQDKNNATACAA